MSLFLFLPLEMRVGGNLSFSYVFLPDKFRTDKELFGNISGIFSGEMY
ncbi:hypothetical protein SAMN05216244_3469 [Sediminibacillus halophilus]|uniref:Uncharacterized protein n=1 Tax=Sediminibacillus halophilus TaxID=482461 RepID=A0A1G9W8A4_9BACI|nr:hypothetical protein SAMN05216244_3469 [Sediminibacillus halophilus]